MLSWIQPSPQAIGKRVGMESSHPIAVEEALVEEAYERLVSTKRRKALAFGILFAGALAGSLLVSEVDPNKLMQGLPGFFDYGLRTVPVLHLKSLHRDLGEWYWGLGRWLNLLLDTFCIGFMATLLGTMGALALCFPASRNLMNHFPVYFLSRRLLEIERAVPELVYALIFVFAFGLGPLPGVLAIAIHSMGALGKLFSEVNENIDLSSVEGVQAAGGNWFQVVRYAVIPQVLPNFASYALLRLEVNVRSAAIVGFVGAGGIGQELFFVIRQFIYTDVSAIVLLLIATVSLIDMTCERLRHYLIGRERQ
jgi:phosphonate transport system permease protein